MKVEWATRDDLISAFLGEIPSVEWGMNEPLIEGLTGNAVRSAFHKTFHIGLAKFRFRESVIVLQHPTWLDIAAAVSLFVCGWREEAAEPVCIHKIVSDGEEQLDTGEMAMRYVIFAGRPAREG